ncbi:unnamed protein product [Amoebophrya sp. A120]|nr:unnamed protein product [Amoebophrya sp. A120]|eukprot:GSA120T00003101001.1
MPPASDTLDQNATAGAASKDTPESAVTDSKENAPAVAAPPGASAEVLNLLAKAQEEMGPDAAAKMLQMLSLQQQPKRRVCAESREAPKDKPHAFWDTQPVPKLAEEDLAADGETGPLQEQNVSDVRKTPLPLPESFEWYTVDIMDEADADEVYTLLSQNYVEDDDSTFRFDYSREFLRWATTPPHYRKHWHIACRVKATKKFVAFISGIPAKMQVCGKPVEVAEINFLCVHKKLRSKRMAPVLIKEVTRRVNLEGVWQAAYTAGVVLPKPVASCRYHHRNLNPKKLIECQFSHLPQRMTMSRYIKLMALPGQHQLDGFRKMEERDIPQVQKLLAEYLAKFKLYPCLDKSEVGHWILPRDKVIYAYVREQKQGKVTDVFSFYNLPSSVLGHEKHKTLNAAYSYLNVATTCTWPQLMTEALIQARLNDFDVFNALDVMDNSEFLTELKFGRGDGYLQYYLFNYRMPKLKSEEVGLVLL